MDFNLSDYLGDDSANLADNLEVQEKSEGKRAQALPVPYCPVKISKLPTGGMLYESYLIGDIVDVDDYIDLIDTLLCAKPDDEYHLYIDSPGGYISAGSIIASAIEHSRAHVYTHAVGLCASAACLIHNAAKAGHASVSDFGILMIHMSLHGDSGVSSQIANRANDQVRYVLENLLRQAKDMGYIYEDELEKIQTGENIYLSKNDFAARVRAKAEGRRADVNTPPPPVVPGTEDWSYDHDILASNNGWYFPNCSDKGSKDYTAQLRGTMENMGVSDEAVMSKVRAIKANTLRVKSNNGIDFRVYIPSDLMMTRTYITNLCLFLSALRAEQTVTFILGAKIIDEIAMNLGAVIAAMESCQAKIITIAAGYCSIPESFIWLYGKERYIFRYGALTFGKTDIVRFVNKYDDYFNAAFTKAKEIGILNDEDIQALNQHKTKMILRQDIPSDKY